MRWLLHAGYADQMSLGVGVLPDHEGAASARVELFVAEADLGKWQEALTLAIRLTGSCRATYLKARPKVRVRFNQAYLQAMHIKDRQIQRAEFTEVFEAFSRAEFE